jgi:hypothetical protein
VREEEMHRAFIVLVDIEVSDGMRFDNWIGACHTEDPVCSLTLNEPTSVTAKFNRKAMK